MVVVKRKELQRTIISTPSGEVITIVNLEDNRIGIEAPESYGIVIKTDRKPGQFELPNPMSLY